MQLSPLVRLIQNMTHNPEYWDSRSGISRIIAASTDMNFWSHIASYVGTYIGVPYSQPTASTGFQFNMPGHPRAEH